MRKIPPLSTFRTSGKLGLYYPGPWGATVSMELPGWIDPERWSSAPFSQVVETPGGVFVYTADGEERLHLSVTLQADGDKGDGVAAFFSEVNGRPFWLEMPHRTGWLKVAEAPGNREQTVNAPSFALVTLELVVVEYSSTEPEQPPDQRTE